MIDNPILAQALDSLFTLIALVAATLATVGIKRMASKWGMELTAEKEKVLRSTAQNAILYAEEWAANKLKLNERAIKSEEKFRTATSRLLEKVPGISEQEAENIITEELPKLGHGATRFIESIGRALIEEKQNKDDKPNQ